MKVCVLTVAPSPVLTALPSYFHVCFHPGLCPSHIWGSHSAIGSPSQKEKANDSTYQVLLLPQRCVYLKQVFQVKAADTQVNIRTEPPERNGQGSKGQRPG